MERFPSPLASHPPLDRDDQPTDLDLSSADRRTLPAATTEDRPCHLPMAWAARPDLDHPLRASA